MLFFCLDGRALFCRAVSAFSGAQAGGGDDECLVTGDVAHGYEGEDGGADREYAGDGEDGALTEGLLQESEGLVGIVALEEVDGDDDLVADEDEGVEVAQADLADAVLERYEGHDAQHRAHYLEYRSEGKALESCYGYEGYGRGISDEADHRGEEHGNEKSGGNGQEESLYSEKHRL